MKYWQKVARRINVKKLSLLEKLMLENAEPANFVLHLLSLVILGYGLWINNLNYVLVAALVALSGHLYVHSKK